MRRSQLIPPFLASLVFAAESGRELLPYVKSVAQHLGFDHFAYGATATPRPDQDGRSFVYMTMSPEWVKRYDRLGYIELDPRIYLSCKSAVPLIWDQRSVRGHGAKIDAFLDDARASGIASGIAFMLHGPQDSHIVITLDSSVEVNDEMRLQAITRNLPDILMFGHYFHDVFMRSALAEAMPQSDAAAPLSKREHQCLTLAAGGMTTGDIATKLNISARTVQFHFDTIRSKLGAANRQEAIALAVQNGTIRARAGSTT